LTCHGRVDLNVAQQAVDAVAKELDFAATNADQTRPPSDRRRNGPAVAPVHYRIAIFADPDGASHGCQPNYLQISLAAP
jgi:hypothetical protein